MLRGNLSAPRDKEEETRLDEENKTPQSTTTMGPRNQHHVNLNARTCPLKNKKKQHQYQSTTIDDRAFDSLSNCKTFGEGTEPHPACTHWC